MMETKKTKEQLRQDTIDALDLFIKNLKEYLRKGTYEIEYIDRDYITKEIEGVTLNLLDQKLVIRRHDAEILFTLKMDAKDLLNQELLDDYNRLSIDKDIRYYEEMLKKLKVQKANLVKAALQKKGEDEVVS
jgi:hypothetical protein